MKKLIITIDGPAASGKEKIAKYISKKWKLNHLGSGILYRRLALIFLNENVIVTNLNLLIIPYTFMLTLSGCIFSLFILPSNTILKAIVYLS